MTSSNMQNFNAVSYKRLDFYGQGGLYDQGRTKEQIAFATTVYLDACAYYEENNMPNMTWGGGDSLDRERVRDLMNNYYGDA